MYVRLEKIDDSDQDKSRRTKRISLRNREISTSRPKRSLLYTPRGRFVAIMERQAPKDV
jgi:hypothetical protein